MSSAFPFPIFRSSFRPLHTGGSRRPFRPIVLGIALFVVLNLLLTVGVTVSPLNRKFNFNYGNYLPVKLEMLRAQQAKQPTTILFLGTSQTNNGFIPSVFEAQAVRLAGTAPEKRVSAFNMGLPNNRYDIMQSSLQVHIRRYGKPRLLLLELSPSIQEKDAYFYYLPALYYRTLIEADPAMAVQWLSNPLVAGNVKKELFLSSLSVLHQYRFTFSPLNILSKVSEKLKSLTNRAAQGIVGKIFHPEASAALPASPSTSSFEKEKDNDSRTPLKAVDPAVNDRIPITDAMTSKGWFPKDTSPHMHDTEGIRLSVEEARKYYIEHQKDVHFDKLKSLLAYCRRERIPVVLVSWPVYPAFSEVFRQSPLQARYADGLKRLQTEAPTPQIDLNAFLPALQAENRDGLFADPRHLTPKGAYLFSQKLALALRRLELSGTINAPGSASGRVLLPMEEFMPQLE